MEFVFYKGKKLQHIEDLNDFLDKEGKTKSDLFNSKGALLVLEGKVPREKIFHIPVFTYQEVYKNFQLNEKPEDSKEHSEEQLLKNKKEKLKQDVGANMLNTYEQASKAINEVIDGEPVTEKKMKTANEFINETLKLDRVKLHTCVSTLRTNDSYTYDHSMSLSILMAQALEDLRADQDKDEFWNIFRAFSGKVDFSKSGLQKYCVGALLHDYGKTLIPKKILNKPGKLTSEEYEIIKTHPRLGTEALSKAKVDDPQVLELVGNHHAEYLTYSERGQSPLAVICNIIDIYDACRSKRVYKEPFHLDKVVDILNKEYVKHKWNPFIYNKVLKTTIVKFEIDMEKQTENQPAS